MRIAPRYQGDARRCVALPLGGIGTGNVAICGDGSLRQWQLHNRPNHDGYLPETFFAVRASSVEPPLNVCRILRSPAPAAAAEPAPNVTDHVVPLDIDPPVAHWPGVPETVFEAAYPFARIGYHDPELPVDVSLEAFTPFVPLDEQASALPLASFRFTISNPGCVFVHGWLLGTLQNVVGWDGATPIEADRCSLFGGNVNRVRRRGDMTAILLDSASLAEDDPRFGELVLATRAPCVAFPRFARSGDALRFVEALKLLGPTIDGDWSAGALRSACADIPALLSVPTGPSAPGQTWSGALAAAFALAPGASRDVEFVIAWRFPNRLADFDQFGRRGTRLPALWVGNHYAERFGTALDAIDRFDADGARLRDQSRTWADAFLASDLPDVAIELLLAQPALIRSPTTFRTADGRFYGFEGSLGASTLNWNGSLGGSCPLNCNHVWNYEQGLSRLFPALERSMRETELCATQAPEGYLPHRVVLPLWLPQLHGGVIGGPERPALDGMLGAVLKSYREVRHGAGLDWLARLWPRITRVVDYAEETWDPDGDGVLVGEQPVTYDIALHGANMFVGGLWLAALRAMEEMARLVMPGRAAGYRERFERASARYDELLFDGEYYTQLPEHSEHEFGRGCLSDQLVGQWWAHQLELGHLVPREHVVSALRAVVRHNLRHGFRGFEHGYRVFADADDSGLLVCTWPKGGRPEVPIRYCDEVWTGVEYQVAAHCIIEGLEQEGLAILAAVRSRYDGVRRNPFNEIECGDHYARGLAGFVVLEALTGARYDAVSRRLAATDRFRRFPFVAGCGWGEIELASDGVVQLRCLGGELDLAELVVRGASEDRTFELTAAIGAGDSVTLSA
jgi:non-lysosomal glucosylceramidase